MEGDKSYGKEDLGTNTLHIQGIESEVGIVKRGLLTKAKRAP